MKLLVLHQSFYPDISGSSIRLSEVMSGLQEKGFDITVLTGLPEVEDINKIPKVEIYNNIRIIRLGRIPFNKNKKLGRILRALSFFTSTFFRVLFSDRKTLVYIGSDPPFLCIVGWLIKVLKNQNYVLHIADLYPDIAIELGYIKEKSFLHKIWKALNKLAYSKAEKIITLGECMKSKILPYSQKNEISIIKNWENSELISPIHKDQNWFIQEHNLNKKMNVLYSGNMGLAHDLKSIILAAEILKTEKELSFLFIGGGGQKEYLKNLVEEKKLSNVTFLPYQPKEAMPYSLNSGDIQIITMKPGTEGLCIPGKFYTALASSSAIIALVPETTEVAKAIKEHQCGVVLAPYQPEALSDSILQLLNDPNLLKEYQLNARKAFENYYTEKRAVEEYTQLLEHLTT